MLVIGLTACSDSFLEQLPTDSKVEENFYKTPKDAYEGLVSVYDALQVDYDGFTNYIIISEIVSDNCYAGGGTGDAANGLDIFQPKFDQFAPIWRKYYMAIYRANLLLSKLDGVAWGEDTELRARYEAEARFLRAYFYFDLTRMFGNIPLVKEPLSADGYYVEQAAPADIYKFIAEDLKFAIENLAATPYGSIPSSEYGRVTKWAAEGLLARVYLFYTGYYTGTNDLAGVFTRAQVTAYVDDIIQNSGHSLVEDFSRLWRAANTSFVGENNKETVWAIKYTYKGFNDANKFDGSRWQVMVGLRAKASPPYGLGWGVGTVSQKLWDSYSTADKRRNSSIVSIAAEGITLEAKDQRQNTGFFWKKFIPYANANGNNATTDLGANYQNDNFEDYPVVRYSDVLLMAAELHLAGGDIAAAQSYYDQVRKRGFGVLDNTITDAVYTSNYARSLSGADAKSLIMEERRYELALEGHRYWDLIRQGEAVAAQAINNASNDEFTAQYRPETKGLLAIPETQINLSRGTLKQNNGW